VIRQKLVVQDSVHLQKVVSKDGTQIACWVSGLGPPLVSVHGTGADHTRWKPVLPALEKYFTYVITKHTHIPGNLAHENPLLKG
jgi:hypothetical protein